MSETEKSSHARTGGHDAPLDGSPHDSLPHESLPQHNAAGSETIDDSQADAPAARSPTSFLAPPQHSDEIGRLGPYRVLSILGAGGMGVVFLAEDPLLKRRIALKTMKPEVAVHLQNRQRFIREAQAAALLESDYIVP